MGSYFLFFIELFASNITHYRSNITYYSNKPEIQSIAHYLLIIEKLLALTIDRIINGVVSSLTEIDLSIAFYLLFKLSSAYPVYANWGSLRPLAWKF